MQGMNRAMIPPNVEMLSRYDVNYRFAVDVRYQPLYDIQTYAAAGQTSLNFFAVQKGQSSKTIVDTNMEAPGQLPAPKNMLVTALEVFFFPGNNPGEFGAQAAEKFWNDTYAVFKGGALEFKVGDKVQNTDAPLGKYVPTFRLDGMAAVADATTLGADKQSRVGYASPAGVAYSITPIRIPPNQNFEVKLSWPTVVALPSSTAGRIGVTLKGFQYSYAQ